MEKVLAVDLDGVLAKDFGLSRFWAIRILVNYFLLFFSIGKYLYLKRKPNEKVVEWIKKRYERGYIILIVSGTFEYHRRLIEAWLHKYKIPYHLLALSHPLLSGIQLKAELTRWVVLIENEKLVAQTLTSLLPVKTRRLGPFWIIRRKRSR